MWISTDLEKYFIIYILKSELSYKQYCVAHLKSDQYSTHSTFKHDSHKKGILNVSIMW